MKIVLLNVFPDLCVDVFLLGPGSYETTKTTFGGPKFSLSGRHRFVRPDATPAPDKYDVLSAFEKAQSKTPAFSMAAKFRNRDRHDKEAPGNNS